MAKRETLLDFFADLAELNGDFLVWDDGYRTHSKSYGQVANAARGFAAKLRGLGIGKGAKVVFWSENRPEWVAALWGCWLEGVIAVPIDFRSSAEFVQRVAGIVEARGLLAGDSVDAALEIAIPVWRFADFEWSVSAPLSTSEPGSPSGVEMKSDDIIQIVFTSGATAEPKGVIITHRNILSNIVPVENEIRKYRKLERPFHPVRFLNLLPLSHLFGQTLATFIPPMIGGTVVFQRSYHPEEILAQIRSRRISVLVSVPKILEVLRDYIQREFPETRNPPEKMHWMRRWWHFRHVHRAFGFKFWAMITGAAPLDPAVETFFRRLGFLVIQGYGLTETAPIVTLNHPFHTRPGTVGTPVGGVELKLAPDGEVLVRGGNVSRGYYGQAAGEGLKGMSASESSHGMSASEGSHGMSVSEDRNVDDGWLATGDIGELDSEGRLSIRGRKKEMIVLPDGRKVFPEDVETVLRPIPGVRDCAVIGPDQVHAVLVTEPAEVESILARANEKLEDQQKIRVVSVWPSGEEFPRTAGTGKLKRGEIAARILTGKAPAAAQAATGVVGILQRYAPGRSITPETRLNDLGLSSLDRIQLLVELEQQAGAAIDEQSLSAARTVADLSKPVAAPAVVADLPLEYPGWNRSWWARATRYVVQAVLARPLTRYFARITVTGAENLKGLQPPLIFAPNHASFMDVPVVLCALPRDWRRKVAPAMSKDWFTPHFHPAQFSRWRRFTSGVQYYSAALFYNAFPIPQREIGARRTFRYMGSLMDQGWCVLIFPEGDRTHAGELLPFRAGTAMLASQTRVPVVPVRIVGLEKVLNRDARWPSHGKVTVAFGEPLRIESEDYVGETKRLEEAMRRLAP